MQVVRTKDKVAHVVINGKETSTDLSLSHLGQNRRSPDLIGKFLNEHAQSKDWSPDTVIAYRNDLVQWEQFLNPAGHEQFQALLNASSADVHLFMDELVSADSASSTLSRRHTCLKNFYDWMKKEGFVKSNPTDSVSRIKQEKKPPTEITTEQIQELLALPCKGFAALRDRALIQLTYQTLAAPSDLLKMNGKNITVDQESKTVTCELKIKGMRQRTQLSFKEAYYLLEYLKLRTKKLCREGNNDPLFLNKFETRLTPKSARRTLNPLLEIAGLSTDLAYHDIRFSGILHWLDRTNQPKQLKTDFNIPTKLRGHALRVRGFGKLKSGSIQK